MISEISPKNITSPGPQSYDIQMKLFQKHQGIKIGTAKKLQSTKAETPGVGAYNIPDCNLPQSPSYGMTLRWPEKKKKLEISPSPQQYKPDYKAQSQIVNSPSYTIQMVRNELKNVIPGPGQYESEVGKQTNGFRFPAQDRKVFSCNRNQPGPGQYDSNIIFVDKIQPKYSFGKSQRMPTLYSAAPGVGTHKFNLNALNETGGLITTRKEEAYDNPDSLTPGPGVLNQIIQQKSYFQSPNQKNFPGHRFSKSQRMEPLNSSMPGPQDYDTTLYEIGNDKLLGFKFGQTARSQFKPKEGPSPGEYDISNPTPKQTALLFGKPKDHLQISKDLYLFPSPNSYSPTSISKGQFFGFNKATRNVEYSTYVPGPGQYSLQQKANYKFALSRTQKLHQSLINTPGPGAYDIKTYNTIEPSIKIVAMKKDLI